MGLNKAHIATDPPWSLPQHQRLEPVHAEEVGRHLSLQIRPKHIGRARRLPLRSQNRVPAIHIQDPTTQK